MIGPGVTLTTALLSRRTNLTGTDSETESPPLRSSSSPTSGIGANATITPGCPSRLSGSVVAACAHVGKQYAPPNCIVSSSGYIKRRDLHPAGDCSLPAGANARIDL